MAVIVENQKVILEKPSDAEAYSQVHAAQGMSITGASAPLKLTFANNQQAESIANAVRQQKMRSFMPAFLINWLSKF